MTERVDVNVQELSSWPIKDYHREIFEIPRYAHTRMNDISEEIVGNSKKNQ